MELRTITYTADDIRWDSAIDRISIKYNLHLDDWKRLGPNQMGKPCGRGWVGLRGACKRGKKSDDNTAKIKESKVALADKIKATKKATKQNNQASQRKQPAMNKIIELPLDAISIDKKRFGSISEADRKSLPKFNSNYAGAIQTWQDPKDGKTYVVNGMKRLESAKKSGESSISTMPIKAKTAEEAKDVGTFSNLASGSISGTAAGQFFRDSNIDESRLKKEGIDIEHPNVRQGLGLAKLDDSVYKRVLDGDLSPKSGEIIGDSPLDHSMQRELVADIFPVKKSSFLKRPLDNLNGHQRDGLVKASVREKYFDKTGKYIEDWEADRNSNKNK